MTFQSRITSKGQVTVPVEIRKKLGLRQGDRVEFSDNGDNAVIRRAQDLRNPFERYRGILNGIPGNVRAIKRWVAYLRDDRGRGR